MYCERGTIVVNFTVGYGGIRLIVWWQIISDDLLARFADISRFSVVTISDNGRGG